MDIYTRFKHTSKKMINKRKEEQTEDLVKIVKKVVADELEPVKKDITEIKNEISTIKNQDIKVLKVANRDSLRNQLLNVYRDCETKGYQTMEDSKNFLYMLSSYRNLDGNSFIENIAKHMENIPTKMD